MEQKTNKKKTLTKLYILAVLAILCLVYFLVPSVNAYVNQVASVLGSANVDTVVAFIRSYGAYAMAFSFALMVFQSVIAPLPAFLITFANAAIFGWWQGAILSWTSSMAGAALCFYLARALGLPRQMEAALHRALTGPRRAMDVGLADGTPFFNLCGTGFDVATLEYAYAARRRLGGRAAYLWGVLRSAARYRGRPMTVEVDGRVFVQGPLLLAAVANGGYLGGGIPVVPSARVDDGLFDILCVRDVPPLARPRYLMGLMRGRIEQFPITLRCRGRRVRLHPAPVRMELDGQIVTLPRGEFTLRPGALWIQG